ncbi:9745_t:CDS:2, partial [Scutellospora calospora]
KLESEIKGLARQMQTMITNYAKLTDLLAVQTETKSLRENYLSVTNPTQEETPLVEIDEDERYIPFDLVTKPYRKRELSI